MSYSPKRNALVQQIPFSFHFISTLLAPALMAWHGMAAAVGVQIMVVWCGVARPCLFGLFGSVPPTPYHHSSLGFLNGQGIQGIGFPILRQPPSLCWENVPFIIISKYAPPTIHHSPPSDIIVPGREGGVFIDMGILR